MHTPRWYTLFCTVFALNVAIVLSASLWKLAIADDLQAPSTSLDQLDTGSPAAGDDSIKATPSATDIGPLKQKTPEALLDELPFPSSLPEVPSLADPETLEKDPIYQEFKSMFGTSLDDALMDERELHSELQNSARSHEYYAKLDQRLTTVRRLTQSAQSIASEAASMSQRGEAKKAGKLLNMATNLREMAAVLLIEEFE